MDIAALTDLQAKAISTLGILATSPEGTIQNLGGRGYTQKNMKELEELVDWCARKIADATRAAAPSAAAGGGAGVAEFGKPG